MYLCIYVFALEKFLMPNCEGKLKTLKIPEPGGLVNDSSFGKDKERTNRLSNKAGRLLPLRK